MIHYYISIALMLLSAAPLAPAATQWMEKKRWMTTK